MQFECHRGGVAVGRVLAGLMPAGLALACLGLAWFAAVAPAMAVAPRPPCGAAPLPAYPPVGAPPEIRLFRPSDVAPDWAPPPCTGWAGREFRLLVAVSGRFAFAGDRDGLLARFARVSGLRGIRYWSISDRRYQMLVTDATALAAPSLDRPRDDFTVAELASGRDLSFAQTDNRSSDPVVYRMRLIDVAPGHIAVAIDNVSAVRRFLVPLFAPGELQSVYFIDRLESGEWGFYSLMRTGPQSGWVTGWHANSYVNRAAALFRYVAGIPTDRDPPAALE